MSRSPRESVEIEVNGDVVSVAVSSEVAEINCSVGVVMGVPVSFLKVSFGDVSFSSVLEDEVGLV